jgi:hypothetical protein
MSFSYRVRAQRQRLFVRPAVSGVIVAMLLTPYAPAFAKSDEDMQRVRLPSAPAEEFEAHVSRKATALFSICEFLSLIDQREVQGTVAGLDFTLNRRVLTGLRLFAAQMLPDGAEERSIDCTPK